MSRNRRRWEESASHWEPPEYGSGRSHYHDDYSRRHYTPSNEPFSRRTFDYWREERSSYCSRRPQGWESYRDDEQWRSDSRARQASHYSRRWRDSGPHLDDLDSRRDARHSPYQSSSRQRHTTRTPAPYIPPPTSRAKSPRDSTPPMPKPAPLPPPRKASTPSQKPSEPRKPSSDYLALAQQPSEILHDPRKTRKLLVLDLNGTLLIRSARSRATSQRAQLRAVYPRPYMQSFKQYLFCEDTKAWLDIMVWSSAQPHSVDDMVDKVFGAAKDELKAVWNRKSLGLSEDEYHQKTVTTKDLAKPWDILASTQIMHSVFTTLLLDDSPHKAALQPYNHVCIPEYDSTRRQRDLRTSHLKGDKLSKAKRKYEQEVAARAPYRTAPEAADTEPYDAILLAVIGVLEAVKLQSNVAGWIRDGGLWAIQQNEDEVGVKCPSVGSSEDGKAIVRSGNDASSTSDPAVTSVQVHLQGKMWFEDALVVAYWVARGRRALVDLGIQVAHGVTG